MAKKKDTSVLNPPSGWGDIDNIQKKDSVQMGIEGLHGTAVEPAEEQKRVRASRGASAGCRPGTTRHTYVLSTETTKKIKSISGFLGQSESATVQDILTKGIAEYESKFGEQVSNPNRGKIN